MRVTEAYLRTAASDCRTMPAWMSHESRAIIRDLLAHIEHVEDENELATKVLEDLHKDCVSETAAKLTGRAEAIDWLRQRADEVVSDEDAVVEQECLRAAADSLEAVPPLPLPLPALLAYLVEALGVFRVMAPTVRRLSSAIRPYRDDVSIIVGRLHELSAQQATVCTMGDLRRGVAILDAIDRQLDHRPQED